MTAQPATRASSPSQPLSRLPTFPEILGKRAAPPVDLFNFYIYMRDREQSEDILDFWLDVKQHENICAAYVAQLRRAGLLDKNEDSEYSPQTWSRYSRQDRFSTIRSRAPFTKESNQSSPESENIPFHSAPGQDSPRNVPLPPSPAEPPEPKPHQSQFHEEFKDSSDEKINRSASPAKGANPTRQDLRLSSDRIYYQYLVPGSEKEIIALLPNHIVAFVRQAVEIENRDDPGIYTEAKDYIFRLMEQEAYPRFLQAKAFENLTPLGALIRLVIGLFCLFCAFTTSFSLIFLDVKPRTVRVWALMPFFLSSWLILSHQWMLDPLLALPPLSSFEATPMHLMRIKEPFVRRFLYKRALKVLALVILLTAMWMAIFVSVPGKRL